MLLITASKTQFGFSPANYFSVEIINPPQTIDETENTENRDRQQGFVERLVLDGELGDDIEGVKVNRSNKDRQDQQPNNEHVEKSSIATPAHHCATDPISAKGRPSMAKLTVCGHRP
jgi:hypothetical protein